MVSAVLRQRQWQCAILAWVDDANGRGVPQDYKQAANWYRKGGEQGNASAQLNIGAMYYDGQGVPKDPKEALKWFRMAAQQGNGRAQFNLATLYTNGEGAPQNLARAVVWFNAAAVTLTGDQAKIADEKSKAVAAKDMAQKCKLGDFKDCE